MRMYLCYLFSSVVIFSSLFFLISSQVDGGLVPTTCTKVWRLSVPYCEYQPFAAVEPNVHHFLDSKGDGSRERREETQMKTEWTLTKPYFTKSYSSEALKNSSVRTKKYIYTAYRHGGKREMKDSRKKIQLPKQTPEFVAVKVSFSRRIKTGNRIES